MKALVSIVAAIVLVFVGAAAAHAECSVSRTYGVNIVGLNAGFGMDLKGCAEPVQAWFEWGTDPGLAGATRIEATLSRPDNWMVMLKRLAPETTYFFRAYARFADGTVVAGTVTSLETQRDRQAFAECEYASKLYGQYAGTDPRYVDRDGLELTFDCNRPALGKILRFKVSSSPEMTGAKLQATATLPEHSKAYFISRGLFLSFDEFPDGATLYVQAELESGATITRGKIVKVELKRSAIDEESRNRLLRQIPMVLELVRTAPPRSREKFLALELLNDLVISIRPREFDQATIDALIALLDDPEARYTAVQCLFHLMHEEKARKMIPKLLEVLPEELCRMRTVPFRTGVWLGDEIPLLLKEMNAPFNDKVECPSK